MLASARFLTCHSGIDPQPVSDSSIHKGILMAQRLLFGLVTLVFVLPSIASALSLGPIEVRSALNEPLDARIPVRAEPAEVESLRAELASEEAFRDAGLDRPYALSEMRFEVIAEGSGAPYVRVRTREPVREPFIAFLADVRWSGGRLRREYTLFLDPPVYSERRDAPAAAPSRAEPDVPPARQPRDTAAAEPRRSAPGTYQVRQGQTAWQVANAVREPGFSVHQTMMALLQANPDAFVGGNVNNLRAGVTLQVPDREQLAALSDVEARRQFVQQTEDWETARQPTPEDPPAVADADEPVRDEDEDEDEPEVAAADDEDDEPAADDDEAVDEEAIDEDAVAASEAADEVDARLQLRGAADLAGDDAAQALLEDDLEATRDNVRLLQDQLLAMRDSEAALRSENEELRQMTDEMRARLDALERAVNLQADPGLASPDDPTPLQDPSERAADDGAVGEDAADEAVAAADGAERAAGPEGADEEIVAPVDDEPGIAAGESADTAPASAADDPLAQPGPTSLEAMLADPRLQYMGGGALLLLLLLVLLMIRRRQQQREQEEAEYQQINSPLPASAVIGASAAGKGADAFAADEALVSRSPLEAADAALADGDRTTAREVINRGLILEPGNQALRLRLLRLHAEEKDLPAFEAEAETLHRQLQDERDPIWQEVKMLALGLGSGHALFAAGAYPRTDAAAEDAAGESAEEFAAAPPEDLPEDAGPEPLQPDPAPDDGQELIGDLDFDLDAEVERALDEGVPGAEDEAAVESPEEPARNAAAADEAQSRDEDWTLDFDLDADSMTAGDEAAPPVDDSGEIDDNGLDFAVDDAADTDDADADDLLPMDEDAFDSEPTRLAPGARPEEAADPLAAADDEGLEDESATKLDLARAYLDMGDADGARALLDEVLDEGSEAQQAEARALMEQAAGGS